MNCQEVFAAAGDGLPTGAQPAHRIARTPVAEAFLLLCKQGELGCQRSHSSEAGLHWVSLVYLQVAFLTSTADDLGP